MAVRFPTPTKGKSFHEPFQTSTKYITTIKKLKLQKKHEKKNIQRARYEIKYSCNISLLYFDSRAINTEFETKRVPNNHQQEILSNLKNRSCDDKGRKKHED